MKHNTGFVGGLTKYGQDRAGLERRNPLIVALGDSVTAGHFEMLVRDPADLPAFIKAGKAVEAVDERESYPERFRERLSDRYLATSVSVINSGIAGDTILGMEARLTRDVISHNPRPDADQRFAQLGSRSRRQQDICRCAAQNCPPYQT